MKVETYITIGVLIVVLIGTGSIFHDKWNEGWEMDKEKICLPYNTFGVVESYEGNNHCSEVEIKEKQKFQDYYCENHLCHPVMKSEEKLKIIYEDWRFA